MLNNLGLAGWGVEVGVHLGRFAEQILSSWQGERLFLVDPWSHQADYADSWNASDKIMQRRMIRAQRRLGRFESRTEWIRLRSEQAVKRFSDASLDCVYIDGNHSFEHASLDLSLWYPKVRPGGLFSGHDYYNAIADEFGEPSIFGEFDPSRLTSYGVKAAVDKFASRNRVEISITREKWPTWYFVRPA